MPRYWYASILAILRFQLATAFHLPTRNLLPARSCPVYSTKNREPCLSLAATNEIVHDALERLDWNVYLKENGIKFKPAELNEIEKRFPAVHGGKGFKKSTLETRVVRAEFDLHKTVPRVFYFLSNELGFKKKEIKELILKYPNILGIREDTLIDIRVWYGERIGLRDRDIRNVLKQFPQIASYSTEYNIAQKVEWFEKRGFSNKELKKIILKHPSVVGLGAREGQKLNQCWNYLTKNLCLRPAQARKMILSKPQVLSHGIDSKLEKLIGFMKEELFVTHAEAGALLVKCPSLPTMSVEANLRPKLHFLRHTVGLSPGELGALLAKYPSLLTSSLEETMAPSYRFLRGCELAFDGAEVRAMLRRCPRLLGAGPDTLARYRAFFLYELGAPAAEARASWLRAPALLAGDFEGRFMENVVRFRLRLRLSNPELRLLLRRCPNLFYLGWAKNLGPKLRFFEEELGLGPAELRGMVVKFPPVLAYSLEGNLAPKLRYFRDLYGLDAGRLRNLAARSPSLLAASLDRRVAPRTTRLAHRLFELRERREGRAAAAAAAVAAAAALGGGAGPGLQPPPPGGARARAAAAAAAMAAAAGEAAGAYPPAPRRRGLDEAMLRKVISLTDKKFDAWLLQVEDQWE